MASTIDDLLDRGVGLISRIHMEGNKIRIQTSKSNPDEFHSMISDEIAKEGLPKTSTPYIA